MGYRWTFQIDDIEVDGKPGSGSVQISLYPGREEYNELPHFEVDHLWFYPKKNKSRGRCLTKSFGEQAVGKETINKLLMCAWNGIKPKEK